MVCRVPVPSRLAPDIFGLEDKTMTGHIPAVKCDECQTLFVIDFRESYSTGDRVEIMRAAVENGWTFEKKGRTREYCPDCSKGREVQRMFRAEAWKKGVLKK
jgi:hypothetical protein